MKIQLTSDIYNIFKKTKASHCDDVGCFCLYKLEVECNWTASYNVIIIAYIVQNINVLDEYYMYIYQ